ncbi:Ig-like domain-containing protein [Bradyrhizobium sp. LHD-71]|uniref:Ig-like domain-containing protein n=1 Tax=Bradyrhizobium sp. LHD-71 TaxID=3072141 RepID=UPI00280E0551|nr:Ig-like domain-containing protein [Bradyrhizobium sp. LHD-71]MDQ8730261.1 Ig-like domain-containing protein [Bradyrhizobium sp. LHD-71]
MTSKIHAQTQARSKSVQCIPDSRLIPPALPQADANGVVDDWRWGLDMEGDILVNVDQLENNFTNQDVITVYFGDAPPQQWIIDPNTNPPDGQPYPFYFKAGELPDGQYNVFYTVTETLSGGNVFCSPNTPVTIVNSPDRQGVVVDHIGTPTINPNNQPPSGTDGIQVTVYDANNVGIPNAWVAFYGPSEATIDPPVTQTNSSGQASCSVTYPDQGTITVDIWCGRKYQDANPVFGQASLYLLPLNPVANNAYADGTQQNQAKATLEYANGTVVTNPSQQQNVIFTLPPDKSATFLDGSKQATIPTVGGYATIAFTDSNELGENVDLNAQLQSGLAKPPPALPFTFQAVWSLPLTPVTNNAAAGSGTPNVAQVGLVTRDGAGVTNGTRIHFQLNSTSSANFVGGGKDTIVKTLNGYAQASFVDSKAELVSVSAWLETYPDVLSTPPSLPFQFKSGLPHTMQLYAAMDWAWGAVQGDATTQNRALVCVTDGSGQVDTSYTGTVVFTLPAQSSASFLDSSDPKRKEVAATAGFADVSFTSSAYNGEKVLLTATLQDGSAAPASLPFTFVGEFWPYNVNPPGAAPGVANGWPALVDVFYVPSDVGGSDSNPHLLRLTLAATSSAYFDPANTEFTVINPKCCQIVKDPSYDPKTVWVHDTKAEQLEVAATLVDVAGQAATGTITFSSS